MRPLRCALFSVCILLCGHAPAAEPEAEKIKLPLPWKQGEVLHYAAERVKTETAPGKREKSVATSKGTVATLEVGKDGYLQQWSWSESKEEVLEGDKSRQAAFAQAAAELEKIALLVEMDAEGHYSRLRNVDGIGQQMLGALRPILLKQVDDELQKQSAAMDAAQRAKARQASMDMLDAFLKRFAEPRMLENLLTKDIQNVLAFSGAVVVIATVVVLIPGAPLVPILFLTQALNAVLLLGVLPFLMALGRDRGVMGDHVLGPAGRWATGLAFVLVAAAVVALLALTVF